jgi:hypothetical protein
MRESTLSPAQIEARMAELESLGFPADQLKGFAEGLLSFCWGASAEKALATLVRLIPADDIVSMAKQQVRFPREAAYAPDYLGFPQLLAIDLASNGLHVEVDEQRWRVALEDGTDISALLSTSGTESKGLQLCRLAVLTMGIREMRRPRKLQPPSY